MAVRESASEYDSDSSEGISLSYEIDNESDPPSPSHYHVYEDGIQGYMFEPLGEDDPETEMSVEIEESGTNTASRLSAEVSDWYVMVSSALEITYKLNPAH